MTSKPPKPRKAMAVHMSRDAQLALATASEAERKELLDFIEKLSTGEIQGEPMTEEEIDRLRDEEGIDLRAIVAEAHSGPDKPAN